MSGLSLSLSTIPFLQDVPNPPKKIGHHLRINCAIDEICETNLIYFCISAPKEESDEDEAGDASDDAAEESEDDAAEESDD